ncbi:MAG: adenosylcobalamin-dependent ribonucleoside-diphosphate reductase [Candidatus Woesearchaeota archaeon]|jgi:ribonucleoside-diphosphate reductase alpha chain|nr:adenosylcobalamin-dependent ribonucleoside-diphosphate reductase [Candidatus Woesearchaeota archaeon]
MADMTKLEANTNMVQTKSEVKRDEFFKKIEGMFSHKSKLSKIIDPQVIVNYKETYFYLFEKIQSGELPCMKDYFSGNVLAKNIYKNKYYLKDLSNKHIEERAEDVFLRIASYVAAVEETQELREEYAEKFYRDLYDGYYLPGGRVLAGAGDLFRIKTLANCFVSVIGEDSLEGIYKAAYEAARTYSYGGGIGIDISQLRPKDSRVHNAADQSTGAVSFMELYSLTTGLIGQSGRRGALMLTIDVKHPDVLDFVNVKKDPSWTTNQIMSRIKSIETLGIDELEKIQDEIIENVQIRFANISIKTSDEFMHSVEEQNLYGKNKILVYKKKQKGGPIEGRAADDHNYSYGISDKKLDDYELLDKFSNVEELNEYLLDKNLSLIKKEQLDDVSNRDFYGDFVMESTSLDYDLAIKYSGDFLTYFKSGSVGEIKELHKARDVWNKFVEGNYKTAEPGLIFWSQMSKYSPSNYVGRPIACTNPCGEVPLEDGGACNLGSINLSRMVKNGYTSEASVDWDLLASSTSNVVRFLDNVVWWNETLNALDKQKASAHDTRRIGVGVMGIADMFFQLGIAYDSEQGLNLLEKVMNHMTQNAYKTSANLAKEKGAAPCYDAAGYLKNPFYIEVLDEDVKELIKEHGVRNIAIMSIAPTGTISNAVCGMRFGDKNYIGISGGIEPVFALYYSRRSEQMNQGAVYKIFHNTVQAYIDMKGLNEQVQGIETEEGLKKILPAHFFRTAHQVSPDMRVKFQGKAQRLIDHSISSTVNLPEDVDPEVISDIYLKSWKEGLKGITIYRDGSRYPILSVVGDETDFQRFKDKKFRIKDGEQIKEVHGNEVLVMPSGKLSTIYHVQKGGTN